MPYLSQKVAPSSNIAKVSYDAASEKLRIVFLSGSSYVYENVPSHVVSELRNAESSGKFFYKFIKDKYGFTKE